MGSCKSKNMQVLQVVVEALASESIQEIEQLVADGDWKKAMEKILEIWINYDSYSQDDKNKLDKLVATLHK